MGFYYTSFFNGIALDAGKQFLEFYPLNLINLLPTISVCMYLKGINSAKYLTGHTFTKKHIFLYTQMLSWPNDKVCWKMCKIVYEALVTKLIDVKQRII